MYSALQGKYPMFLVLSSNFLAVEYEVKPYIVCCFWVFPGRLLKESSYLQKKNKKKN